MKKSKSNNSSSTSVFGGAIGTILMTLLITVAFGVLIYGMYVTDFISVIDFSAVISNKNTEDDKINNDVVYDILKDESDLYEFVYETTPDELTEILSDFVQPEVYSFKATVVKSATGDVDTVNISGNKTEDVYIIEKSRNGNAFEKIELDNAGDITVTDINRNISAKHKSTDGIGFEEQCGIPSVEGIAAVCGSIADKTANVGEYTVSLVSRDNASYYYVSFVYTDIEQREEFYVSSDKGVICDAYTYINGTLVYRYHLDQYVA